VWATDLHTDLDMPPASASTEFAIVSQALADMMGRLTSAAQTPAVQQLAARANNYRRLVGGWDRSMPSEAERTMVVRNVLDMQIELMKAGFDSNEITGAFE
jgi:hypothetical protein